VTSDNRARIARKRAHRLGLQLVQRGAVFTVRDGDDTLSRGMLGVVDAYLIARLGKPRPAGPEAEHSGAGGVAPLRGRLSADFACGRAAASHRSASAQHSVHDSPAALDCPARRGHRRQAAGLARPPNNTYRRRPGTPTAPRCADSSPGCTSRGGSRSIWGMRCRGCGCQGGRRALLGMTRGRRRWRRLTGVTELMLRLAAEAGLRRAEIAQVHASHLDGTQLLVHGKGAVSSVSCRSVTIWPILSVRRGRAGCSETVWAAT